MRYYTFTFTKNENSRENLNQPLIKKSMADQKMSSDYY